MGEKKGKEGLDKQVLRQGGTLQLEHTRLQDQDARNYPSLCSNHSSHHHARKRRRICPKLQDSHPNTALHTTAPTT